MSAVLQENDRILAVLQENDRIFIVVKFTRQICFKICCCSLVFFFFFLSFLIPCKNHADGVKAGSDKF